jgi:hypothetical protein
LVIFLIVIFFVVLPLVAVLVIVSRRQTSGSGGGGGGGGGKVPPDTGGGGGTNPVLPPPPGSQCGIRKIKTVDPQIVAGSDAYAGKWPWMANLFNCGGCIIASTWILTAAHCVENASDLEVVLGVFDTASNENQRVTKRVKRVIIHPDYNKTNLDHDIALLQLSTPIEYDGYKSPICLPPANIDLRGKSLYAAGWGNVRPEVFPSTKPTKLQDILLQEVDPCPNFRIDPKRQLCASSALGGRICFGDSGGPLMMQDGEKWMVVGVVSFATDPCTTGPGGFTRVSYYLKWIQLTIGS